MSTLALNTLETVSGVSNDAVDTIGTEEPYVVETHVRGSAPFLFHRWSCDDIAAKGKAKKGSAAKKEDNLESYVWRNTAGELSIPGEYFRMAIIGASKFQQDPRSPRKSAMDLYKAGICTIDELCTLRTKDWSYLDRRRVMIQRNGITRVRPAMNTGWEVAFTIQVILPQYISASLLNETIQNAGRLIGVGDFRPTFGRFQIVRFRVIS